MSTPDAVTGTAWSARREALLAVEGIHCASCVQLIEMSVSGLPGVVSADAGLATHRLRVRVQPGKGAPGSNKVEFEVRAINHDAIAVHEKAVFLIPR